MITKFSLEEQLRLESGMGKWTLFFYEEKIATGVLPSELGNITHRTLTIHGFTITIVVGLFTEPTGDLLNSPIPFLPKEDLWEFFSNTPVVFVQAIQNRTGEFVYVGHFHHPDMELQTSASGSLKKADEEGIARADANFIAEVLCEENFAVNPESFVGVEKYFS